MPVPKFRTSNSKRDRRRSHHSLSAANTSSCVKCGYPVTGHAICPRCGHYHKEIVKHVPLLKLTKENKYLSTMITYIEETKSHKQEFIKFISDFKSDDTEYIDDVPD